MTTNVKGIAILLLVSHEILIFQEIFILCLYV